MLTRNSQRNDNSKDSEATLDIKDNLGLLGISKILARWMEVESTSPREQVEYLADLLRNRVSSQW